MIYKNESSLESCDFLSIKTFPIYYYRYYVNGQQTLVLIGKTLSLVDNQDIKNYVLWTLFMKGDLLTWLAVQFDVYDESTNGVLYLKLLKVVHKTIIILFSFLLTLNILKILLFILFILLYRFVYYNISFLLFYKFTNNRGIPRILTLNQIFSIRRNFFKPFANIFQLLFYFLIYVLLFSSHLN